MTKLMHGIVHGQTIQVNEDLGLSDGQAVDLIVLPVGASELSRETDPSLVTSKKLPGPPPGWKPGVSTTAGVLAEEWTEEDDRILEQIQADRKAATWRGAPQ